VPEESGKTHCSQFDDAVASMVVDFEKLMVAAQEAEPRHQE